MKNLLPDLVGKKGLVSLIIEARPDALNELCLHWFLGHHLKERTSDQAIFLFEEKSMHHQVPYFLISYGKSIQVIEPQSVREKLVAIASELMEYYQL
jgi:predicted DNA-binding transcriptional regulator YafY